MASPQIANLVEMFERSVTTFGPNPLFGVKRGPQWPEALYAE